VTGLLEMSVEEGQGPLPRQEFGHLLQLCGTTTDTGLVSVMRCSHLAHNAEISGKCAVDINQSLSG